MMKRIKKVRFGKDTRTERTVITHFDRRNLDRYVDNFVMYCFIFVCPNKRVCFRFGRMGHNPRPHQRRAEQALFII